MKNPLKLSLLWGLSLTVAILSTGCQQRVSGIFAMIDLEEIERMAVINTPPNPNHEQIFMAHYLEIFDNQKITFVARHADLDEIINQQGFFRAKKITADLEAGHLNERTRTKLRELLGVEAIAICAYGPSEDNPLQYTFRVRIINTATGGIVAAAIVKGPDHFSYLSYTAIKKIHQAVKKEHRRTYRSGNTKIKDPNAYDEPSQLPYYQ